MHLFVIQIILYAILIRIYPLINCNPLCYTLVLTDINIINNSIFREQIRNLEKEVSQLKKHLKSSSISGGTNQKVPGGGETWQSIGGKSEPQQPQVIYTYPVSADQNQPMVDGTNMAFGQPMIAPMTNNAATSGKLHYSVAIPNFKTLFYQY